MCGKKSREQGGGPVKRPGHHTDSGKEGGVPGKPAVGFRRIAQQRS